MRQIVIEVADDDYQLITVAARLVKSERHDPAAWVAARIEGSLRYLRERAAKDQRKRRPVRDRQP